METRVICRHGGETEIAGKCDKQHARPPHSHGKARLLLIDYVENEPRVHICAVLHTSSRMSEARYVVDN